MFDRIAPYARPLTDPERSLLIEQTLMTARAHRAMNEALEEFLKSDDALEVQLVRIMARARSLTALEPDAARALKVALQEAVQADLLPEVYYSDEELEF